MMPPATSANMKLAGKQCGKAHTRVSLLGVNFAASA